MNTSITKYNCITNIGHNIDEVYQNAINGTADKIVPNTQIAKGKTFNVGMVSDNNIKIDNPNYDLKCNRLLIECIEPMKDYIFELKKQNKKIGIVCATTNSGVEEFETSQNPIHSEIGNPAVFLKEYLGTNNYTACVSTACTSGIKAFSLARNLLNSKLCDAVIVAGVDTLAKVPLYGFASLEVLSEKHTNPMSKNRSGINIGEGVAVFVVENSDSGIGILGIGETTDTYHSTTPDPKATEAIRAIKLALNDAKLKPQDIDYINLHGTGTIANDLTEARAIGKIFKNTFCSSTKPMTGHCLGASSSVESALCCALIDKGGFYPHIYDGEYDESLPKINLSNPPKETKICMNNAFGFGGTNAIMILGRGK